MISVKSLIGMELSQALSFLHENSVEIIDCSEPDKYHLNDEIYLRVLRAVYHDNVVALYVASFVKTFKNSLRS